MENCTTLVGILGAILGFIASEIAHYVREWFSNHMRRKLAAAHAKLELHFQWQNADILLTQYSAARQALGGNEKFSRVFPRIVVSSEGLERAKNQLIETGGDEHLIIALHKAIREVMIVESVRPEAMAKLEELLGCYSKEHHGYVGYKPWIGYLASLDTALEAAKSTLADAERHFHESGIRLKLLG